MAAELVAIPGGAVPAVAHLATDRIKRLAMGARMVSTKLVAEFVSAERAPDGRATDVTYRLQTAHPEVPGAPGAVLRFPDDFAGKLSREVLADCVRDAMQEGAFRPPAKTATADVVFDRIVARLRASAKLAKGMGLDDTADTLEAEAHAINHDRLVLLAPEVT